MKALGWRKNCCLATCTLLGILLLVVGCVFNLLVDLIIQAEIKKTLPLKNGTMAYKFWQRPPVPVSFGIYVFDVVNPAEVLAGEEPPAVVEKGPYVYRMHIEKTDIVWHKNNTVEYVQPQTFVFDREASVGPDTDTFLTVNIPYITTATILQQWPSWIQTPVDLFFFMHKEEAFMNRSVSDIWWGYQDPILEDLAELLHKFNITSPLLNGKFGFFMDRNNTGDGLYNVFSGLNETFDNYVHIDRWNGKRNLSIWTTDYANSIRGTDGSMQPPHVTSDSRLSIFDAYLHRSLKLVYSSTSSYLGVRTLRFHLPYSEFASGKENPDNLGFCTPNCIPSGAYNMSVACYYAPMYVSLPHFVGGDPYYHKLVTGLAPSQSLHQPYYDIQAMTGVSMRAARRYQINVRTQSFQHFTKFTKFPESYLPVLWIDGVASIDTDTASMFKTMIQDPLDAMIYVRAAIFALAAFLLLIASILFIHWRRKTSKYDRLENENDFIKESSTPRNYGIVDVASGQLNTQPEDLSLATDHSSPDRITPTTNNVTSDNTPLASHHPSHDINDVIVISDGVIAHGEETQSNYIDT